MSKAVNLSHRCTNFWYNFGDFWRGAARRGNICELHLNFTPLISPRRQRKKVKAPGQHLYTPIFHGTAGSTYIFHSYDSIKRK